jgi:uncharacterized membrane protein
MRQLLHPRTAADATRSLVIVTLLFTLSRLLVAAVRVPFLIGSDRFFDYRFFLEMSQLSDQGWYPYLHYWSEYPPLFPWLSVAAYRLSALSGNPLATEAAYYTLTTVLRIAGEVGSFVLIICIARDLWGLTAAVRSALLYALLFLPYYLWNGAFDSLPVFLFLLALWLLIRQRDQLSAVAAALGAASKIFPALIVPIAFITLPGMRRKWRYVAVFAAVLALIFAPFLLANPAMTLASLINMTGRNAWLTVWALAEGYYGAGGVASLSQRFDPASALLGRSSDVASLLALAIFGLIFALFYWRFWIASRGKAPLHPLRVVAAAGFTLHMLLLYSRGYSPQFLMWIAPLIAILFPNRRGAIHLALLGIVNLVEYPLYLKYFPDQTALLVFVVFVRTALISLIAVQYLVFALRNQPQSQQATTPSMFTSETVSKA